jgi:hypothetical protein
VPSAAHLVWLALIEYKQLDPNYKTTVRILPAKSIPPASCSAAYTPTSFLAQLPPAVIERTEFHVLLDRVLQTHPAGHEKERTELKEYYHAINQDAPASPTERLALGLSGDTFSLLKRALHINFALTHELIQYIISLAPIFRDTTKALIEMHVEVIGLALDRGGDESRYEASSLLKFLFFPKEMIPDGVDALFERFVRYAN